MKTKILRSGWLLLIWVVAAVPILRAQERDLRDFLGLGAAPDAKAAQLGEPLYLQNCAACHGENARGAQGPNLVRSTLVLHDEKGRDIGPVIRDGRPGAGMPPFPKLSADQIYDISEYLHLQVEKAANRGLYGKIYADRRSQIKGDAQRGQQFFTANCSGCHSVTGDLAKIATRFPEAAALQSHFIWPVSHAPVHAEIKTNTGETVSGSIVKLDDFIVDLRDAQGQLHHWSRDQVQVHAEDKLEGHRALLPKYTDDDLHNVTAYLLELK